MLGYVLEELNYKKCNVLNKFTDILMRKDVKLMKKFKILGILVALVMLIMQLFSVLTSVNAANIGETKNLERGEKGYYCVQKWNGGRWIYLTYNQTFYTDTDGQRYIAYCLDPGLPGVGYVSGEKDTYPVKITELLNNDVIWRVLKNGYPTKSISDLGVETADDAYFATMQAINSILRGYTLAQAKELYSVGKFPINGENLGDIQRRGEKTLNAMFNLIDIGLNGTETRNQFLNISIKSTSESKEDSNNFYSQTFIVESASEISEYIIDKIEGLPQGSYVSDESGKEKQSFRGGEKFKIMIPKNSISKDIKGKVTIRAKQKNYPIYFGASSIEGFQDYALCNNSYSEVNAQSEIYVETNKSKLTILKVDKDTQNPIQGVKFQITSTEGTVNTFVTDKNGKIMVTNQRPGTLTIKEIATIGNYKLNTNETKVELKYNEAKEIKIENELKRGSIKVIKIDKDNNKIRIPGVEFKIYDEKGKEVESLKTDKNGEAISKKLPINQNYKVQEVKTLDTYVLNEKTETVTLKEDEITTIQFENERKKGGIKIIKTDKDNKEIKLANVKFQLKDEKNNVIQEGKTDENGELNFENLIVGKYKIVEVETDNEYILSNEEIVVDVTYGNVREVHIENEKIKIPEKIEHTVVKKQLPKTGSNDSIYGIMSNVFCISLYSMFAVIKKIF